MSKRMQEGLVVSEFKRFQILENKRQMGTNHTYIFTFGLFYKHQMLSLYAHTVCVVLELWGACRVLRVTVKFTENIKIYI